MNICMFTNTYVPHVGGVAKSVASFEKDLRKLGHKVLVIAPTFPGIPGDEDEERVLRVPAIQKFNGSDFSARIPIPFLINQKIDEFCPDIIHSHHPYLIGDTAIRTAARRYLPIVFTHHTLYEEYAHYVSSSRVMKKFVIRLSTDYANCSTCVVAPSKSIADLIRQRGVTTPVAEIPTGIDYDEFQKGDGTRFRKKAGIDEGVDLIGHVGRLAPEKNLGFLADAVKIYLKTNSRAKFLVVGDGPDSEKIKKTFEKDNLAKSLVMTGKQTGGDLVDAYHAMDLFVFSSLSETQGLVVAEAMAAGNPVIALNASGVREVVSDNENGRLLPARASVKEFSDVVSDYFKNRDRSVFWRNNALETAKKFDRMKMAVKMAQLYERTLQKKLKPEHEYNSVFDRWENLLHLLKAEWDLLSSKVGAIADSIGFDENHYKK